MFNPLRCCDCLCKRLSAAQAYVEDLYNQGIRWFSKYTTKSVTLLRMDTCEIKPNDSTPTKVGKAFKGIVTALVNTPVAVANSLTPKKPNRGTPSTTPVIRSALGAIAATPTTPV